MRGLMAMNEPWSSLLWYSTVSFAVVCFMFIALPVCVYLVVKMGTVAYYSALSTCFDKPKEEADSESKRQEKR